MDIGKTLKQARLDHPTLHAEARILVMRLVDKMNTSSVERMEYIGRKGIYVLPLVPGNMEERDRTLQFCKLYNTDATIYHRGIWVPLASGWTEEIATTAAKMVADIQAAYGLENARQEALVLARKQAHQRQRATTGAA